MLYVGSRDSMVCNDNVKCYKHLNYVSFSEHVT